MGFGSWDTKSYSTFAATTCKTMCADGSIAARSVQETFTQTRLANSLNPYNAIRESCDSAEHPNTLPVILGIDVTGSMGPAAKKVVEQLNPIMTELYKTVDDIQFMTMGIGDLAYDEAPLQVSQFESDIRIAEQLDKIYFEFGGGGNNFESYTEAWFFGTYCTKLDCWKRGKKGIIITLGDEQLNPYLPIVELQGATGLKQLKNSDLDTPALYEKAKEKFDIFHFSIDTDSCYARKGEGYRRDVDQSWTELIGQNYRVVSIDKLKDEIVNVINECKGGNSIFTSPPVANDDNVITW